MSENTLKATALELPKEIADRLVDAAAQARRNSYSPYSGFSVGAAVLTDDGRIFSGTNVENASYGATMCAERSAVFAAISAGAKRLEALAIVADYPKPVPPCGMCRQVLSEFGKGARVVMANTAGARHVETVGALMPFGFELDDQKMG